jgi:hypothetical protein
MLLLALIGCGTMNTARALHPGEHALGLTFGGPILTSPIPTPLPSLVVEGRVGLPLAANRPSDLRFGADVTGLAFGTIAVHAGWTWQLADALKARPAFAVTNQAFFATNLADWTKEASARTAWGVYHLEATVSWDTGPHILYTGLAEYLDFTDPDLLLTPFVGFEIDATKARVQIEVRWYAINQVVDRDDIDWLTPGVGALGLLLGVTIPLGGAP